jgi:beta-glucosidase
MNTRKAASLAVLAVAACVASFAQTSSVETLAYRNPALPVNERVDDLISRMTLHEKISQVAHTADAIPRLGIPEYDWWNEGLHGVARAGYATVFPQAIGMAAMFDEPLMHDIADVISTEFRAKYYANLQPDGSSKWYRGLTIWSPNINIFRDPRWGRGQETYGEDPYLTSRLGVAFVTGLQGNDPKYLKTVATSKHYAVHSGPEATRHSDNVDVSLHDLNDTYLPAFRATVTEGKVESIMCAYNAIDGQPACANEMLLKKYLRDGWKFHGYVVSDCAAVSDIFNGHYFTNSIEEATAAAFKTGTDLICGMPPQTRVKYERDALENAVKRGIIKESVVDQSLRRLFTARFRLGMFDPSSMVPYSRIQPSDNDTEAHRELARKAAREAIVLLKNADDLLPLKQTYKTIAVIGPNADSVDVLVGNYNGTPSQPVTVLSGIRKRFAQSRVVYAPAIGLVGQATIPVSPEALFTDSSRSQHGLKGEYFPNLTLEGAPAMTRIDRSVNFAWGDAGVSPQLLKNYSVRWTGVLVPSETADYMFGFTGEDGYRVWLDGKVVVEDWTPHRPATTELKQVHLEAGHVYDLRIEYFQMIRLSEARLIWSIPDAEQKAMDAARSADLVVVALGLSPRLEGEEMKVNAEGFASGDRTRIDLPDVQQRLLEQIHALNKPTVLVLLNGSALAVNWADENVPAIIEAWYPGEEGGTAVAEALAGDFSPAGRLPVTFYKSVDQLRPFKDYSMADRTYRYFGGEPLYPFGYGLSYTKFEYRNSRVDRAAVEAADPAVTISVDVANTGNMDGDEVVQLYLAHPGVAGAPIRALEGFQRVHLARGEQKTVSFRLRNRQLSIVDESGTRRIVPGTIEAWIGGGQPVTRSGLAKPSGARQQFTVTGTATLPE